MYNERLLSCFSIFLTQVGNVFDQNETYDCAVSGDLFGFAALATPLAAPDPEAELVPGDAACATADRALAKFGRDPLDDDDEEEEDEDDGGARTDTNGEEAAADRKLAKLEAADVGDDGEAAELDDAVLTGRVWM